MSAAQVTDRYNELRRLVAGLVEDGAATLQAVVLYGPAAHDDFYEKTKELHVLVVTQDLALASLATISRPIRRWLKKGYAMPRFFSPDLIASAADVFPLDFLRIADHHIVLHGRDPFATLEVGHDNLRRQCERELREKMMRLREGYLQSNGKSKALRRLAASSFVAFAEVFRGCLLLFGDKPPRHNRDVVSLLGEKTGIDVSPLLAVEDVITGKKDSSDLADAIEPYYTTLSKLVAAIDQHRVDQHQQESSK